MKNLVETAIDAGNLKILIKVLQEAGLVDILTTDGPYTIFAPTDEAFLKLPTGTIEDLLQDKEKLTNLLTNHILPNQIIAKNVANLQNVKTINGKNLKIKTGKSVKIDNAKIITNDIKCTNGIIHVIDEVLLII